MIATVIFWLLIAVIAFVIISNGHDTMTTKKRVYESDQRRYDKIRKAIDK